jgi:tetratricopeptide (TPR) repeat protein
MRDLGRRSLARLVTLGVLLLFLPAWAAAAVKPRAVLVVPFDATALERDEQWLGEGLAQLVTLGLTQHPACILIDRARLRASGQPDVWGEAVVLQAARATRAEAALFGRVSRAGGELVIQPILIELRATGNETIVLEPVKTTAADLLVRAAVLPAVYAKTLKVPLTEAESARMDRAARPTTSLRALELFARGQLAARRGGQEANETAVDLLSRAIEADPNFVVAHYTLGEIHQTLGNRWKAAAQFRASTQLDATYPEPYKALGELFLAAPRRLFDQAVEAYAKAIELRPFYADAHVGLGDARAAKGDVDGAVKAYQQALVYNPVNPRVHMSLGKMYYTEKGLYYEAVTAYKKAIDLDPASVEARMGLGEVYEDKGLYKEAIGEYRHVVGLDSRHTGALYNLAMVYEKVDPREAMAQWERYIALAAQVPAEKDWVDVARQHLRKLKNTVKD